MTAALTGARSYRRNGCRPRYARAPSRAARPGVSTATVGGFAARPAFRRRMRGASVGQFIVLVPELDLVVVTTSDSTPTRDARSQRRRIFNLVEQQVVAPAATVLRRAGSSRGNAG